MQILHNLIQNIQKHLPSRYQRWVVLGIFGTVIVGVLYLAVRQTPPPKPAHRAAPQQRQVFIPQNLDKRMGISGVSTELDRIRKQNAELQKKLEQTQEMLQGLKGKLPDAGKFQADLEKRLLEQLKQQAPPPKPEEPPKAPPAAAQPPAGPAPPQPTGKGKEWWREFQQQEAKTPPQPGGPREAQPAKPGAPGRPDTPKPGDIRVVSAKDQPKGEGVAAVKDAKRKAEDKGTFLPAGSIFSGTLLTGMDVPTGHQGRRDPFPVLLRVKKEAILPNRYRTDVRECFLVASGWGDLSSERAYVRAERLSCIRDDGKALESNIQMYAVGEDGKAGIRGRVVNKTGALLGRALVAGFLEGFSKLFGKQPLLSLNTGAMRQGQKALYESYLSSDALQSAGLAGAGSAMDRLAKYYIDMAEGIYPVIEVDAGRAIDFILLSGVSLKLQQGKVTVGE